MLRGTVYLVDAAGIPLSRCVVTVVADNAAEFRVRALLTVTAAIADASPTLEFGPIAPPWSR